MKKLLKINLLLFIGLLVLTSCSKDDILQPEFDLARYEQLSKTLEFDLNQIGLHLRDNSSNFSEGKSVVNAAEFHYGKVSDNFNEFLKYFDVKISKNTSTNDDLTDFQKENVEEIIAALSNYSSLSEFQLFLDEKFEYFSNQTLETNDKEFILNYIVSYKVSLDFIDNNRDLFGNTSDKFSKSSWWSSWGKCVAGTLGGAITGALGGAAIGSAVPVIGTTAGGIVGAVGGALTGAAASCGNDE